MAPLQGEHVDEEVCRPDEGEIPEAAPTPAGLEEPITSLFQKAKPGTSLTAGPSGSGGYPWLQSADG